jgi:hypothetical protein
VGFAVIGRQTAHELEEPLVFDGRDERGFWASQRHDLFDRYCHHFALLP